MARIGRVATVWMATCALFACLVHGCGTFSSGECTDKATCPDAVDGSSTPDGGDGSVYRDASADGDVATDAMPDVASDVGADVSPDTGVDSGADAAHDGGADAPFDGGPDAPADAGADGAPDAAQDAGSVLLVFVSSKLSTGNLGGLAGADATCQSLATKAGLPGTYKAWLSSQSTDAASRLTHGSVPYKLVDGSLVANDWSTLVSGTLLHAIDKTESNGAPPTGTVGTAGGCAGSDPLAWTNTNDVGTHLGPSCNDWTSTAGNVSYVGAADMTSGSWTWDCTAVGSGVCAATAALYCVQQ
jgi:hypothetical protein